MIWIGIVIGAVGMFLLLWWQSERACAYYKQKLKDMNNGNV